MIKQWLQGPKQRPRGHTQMGGEEVPLQKVLGWCRKQRYALILEFNIFYRHEWRRELRPVSL